MSKSLGAIWQHQFICPLGLKKSNPLGIDSPSKSQSVHCPKFINSVTLGILSEVPIQLTFDLNAPETQRATSNKIKQCAFKLEHFQVTHILQTSNSLQHGVVNRGLRPRLIHSPPGFMPLGLETPLSPSLGSQSPHLLMVPLLGL